MSWVTVGIGDTNKGNTIGVVKTNSYVSFPFPCADSTDCTFYSAVLGAGVYQLEVWGAQGGNDTSYSSTVFGGRGGYSVGTVQLKTKTTLYIYVGGSGTGLLSGSRWGSTGGGGATDIRIQNGAWNDNSGLKSRIIVAGGGGGRLGKNWESVTGFLGNDGGGTVAPTFSNSGYTVYGASQNSGGSSSHSQYHVVGSFGYATTNANDNVNSKGGYNGGSRGSDNWGNGGAGGGWWGGCTAFPDGSGGSGFIYTSSNSQCSASSDFYLTNASTYVGNTEFASPYGGKEIGHRGNGFAKITNLYLSPSPSATKDILRDCYTYFNNRKINIAMPLISVFIFSLLEGEFSKAIHMNLELI
jgi:hypothetical protein